MAKSVQSSSNFITYEHFAKVYLLMAKFGLLERLKDRDDRNLNKGVTTLDDDERWRLYSGMILVPVIFCIRHSIELFLKSIYVGKTSSYLSTHDLLILIQEIQNTGINLKAQEEFLVIVRKYADYDFETVLVEGDAGEIDKMNDLFRFPDSNSGMVIKGENLALISSTDILDDIASLRKWYTKISIFWQGSMSC